MANYFGIDFGTTNSAVFTISSMDDNSQEDRFRVGENESRPLPSYVAINRNTGEVMTGSAAKNTLPEGDEYEIFPSIKTIIGEKEEWQIAGKTWTPIDIAAELFKALKQRAEATANCIMKTAVVAVPIGFSSVKKSYLRKAALLAGINIVMFVSEPTAAFCSQKSMRKYHNVAVFDWGGGTLDVVVLKVDGNYIREISTVGLPIAGNDVDRILAHRVCENASRKSGVDYSFDSLSRKTQLRILRKCEDAKISLADNDIVNIVDGQLDDYGMLYERIDYDYFSLLIENEVESAFDCLLEALSKAGMNRESIDCILFEGGSSRLRPLQARMLRYFDRSKLIFPQTAMWDIASGAAEIAFKPGCYTLGKPIGLTVSDGSFYPLLKEGQRIPTEENTVTFGIVDGSSEAKLVITDGENGEQSFKEYFPVKLRGDFSDEYISVTYYIDSYMIFRLKVVSNRMPKEYFRAWNYPNVKVAYELDAPKPDVMPIDED